MHDSKLSKRAALPAERSELFEINVMSFGYKRGAPPDSNIVFDVRFLKNPYWVEELRPLSGLDQPVQKYVLEQEAAREFLESVLKLLSCVLPEIAALKTQNFTIAFGCTGGQHRSATLAEALARELSQRFPQFVIKTVHRELGKNDTASESTPEDGQ